MVTILLDGGMITVYEDCNEFIFLRDGIVVRFGISQTRVF